MKLRTSNKKLRIWNWKLKIYKLKNNKKKEK